MEKTHLWKSSGWECNRPVCVMCPVFQITYLKQITVIQHQRQDLFYTSHQKTQNYISEFSRVYLEEGFIAHPLLFLQEIFMVFSVVSFKSQLQKMLKKVKTETMETG